MVSAVVEKCNFVQLGGCRRKGRNAPRNTATKGKRWGPPCGLSTIAFVETRLKAGKVQSVAPTQGIPPPLPPDNLPTAQSGLHSLRGFRQPLAPPTSWEVIESLARVAHRGKHLWVTRGQHGETSSCIDKVLLS